MTYICTMTKKEIKLETIKANREQVVNAITEAIKGTDLKLKDAMNLFLGARSNPESLTSVMCNGLQAVRKAAEKVGNRAAKLENRQYFMTTPNQLPSSMR